MIRHDPLAIASAGVASAYSWVAAVVTWSSPFGFVGIPAPVAFMAFAGAAAGLVVQPPKLSRWAMLVITLAFTLFASCGAVLLGSLPHLTFLQGVAPAVSGILAFFAQALVPSVRRRLSLEIVNRGTPGNSDGESP